MKRFWWRERSRFKIRVALFAALAFAFFMTLGALSDGHVTLWHSQPPGDIGGVGVDSQLASLYPGSATPPTDLPAPGPLAFVDAPKLFVPGSVAEFPPTGPGDVLSALQDFNAVPFSTSMPGSGNAFAGNDGPPSGNFNPKNFFSDSTFGGFPFGGGGAGGGGPQGGGHNGSNCDMPECKWTEWMNVDFTPPPSSNGMAWNEWTGDMGPTDDMGWPMGSTNLATLTDDATASVPEPTTLVLMGSGLVGVAAIAKRRTRGR